MGYKVNPEILQTITSAIAGVTTVVHRLWAAPPLVRDDVWIGNIRIAGSKAMRHCGKPKCFVMRTVVTPRWGRNANRALRSTPFCGCSLITLQTVSLSDKFVRCVCAMPALNSSTITEMEVMASRFLYAAAIFGTQLCDYYFFIKAVRRRLSAVNQGIVLETSPKNVPPAAVGLGERLRHIIENNCG
ncbi:putative target of rapamycin (TOR) kinase 1 [Trypanosoma cruzi]|nr:putative target of rapamycin (TOR) kinase 1 [Trypanosoma cruzi]